MKKNQIRIASRLAGFAVLLAVAFSVSNCSLNRDKSSAAEMRKTAARNYEYSQRKAYARQMKRNLSAVGKELESLKKIAAKATGETKTETDRRIQELVSVYDDLGVRINKAVQTGESEWDQVKSDVSASFEKFQENIHQAGLWLSRPITE